MIFMLVMLLYGLISTVPESSLYLLFSRSSLYSLSDCRKYRPGKSGAIPLLCVFGDCRLLSYARRWGRGWRCRASRRSNRGHGLPAADTLAVATYTRSTDRFRCSFSLFIFVVHFRCSFSLLIFVVRPINYN